MQGFGQPQCGNSETCLFKTATDGNFYEGCGETSIAYDWVTGMFWSRSGGIRLTFSQNALTTHNLAARLLVKYTGKWIFFNHHL